MIERLHRGNDSGCPAQSQGYRYLEITDWDSSKIREDYIIYTI